MLTGTRMSDSWKPQSVAKATWSSTQPSWLVTKVAVRRVRRVTEPDQLSECGVGEARFSGFGMELTWWEDAA